MSIAHLVHTCVCTARASVASVPMETNRRAVCSEADLRKHNGDGEEGGRGSEVHDIEEGCKGMKA